MNKKRLVFIFGTRPEFIKLAPLIRASRDFFSTKVISTGQHEELLDSLCSWFDVKIDFELSVLQRLKEKGCSRSPSSVVSQILLQLESVFDLLIKDSSLSQKAEPDLVVVQGDTSSAFAGALSGFLKKIPVAHVEAGLRTNRKYDPFPEEVFRAQISQIASFHFAPTNFSLENLRKENIKENCFVVGNTIIDSLKYTLNKLEYKNQNIISSQKQIEPKLLRRISQAKEEKKRIVLVTMHRRENLGQRHLQVAKALNKITQTYQEVSVFFPLHLNPEVRQVLVPALRDNRSVKLLEPLDYLNFVYLMNQTEIILTDSGGIQEEASFLGKPLLILRESTERPEVLKEKNALLVGLDSQKIFKVVSEILESEQKLKEMSRSSLLFGQGDSAQQITRALAEAL